LQQLLHLLNNRVYVKEYRELIAENQNGYLGVGVHQPKLGVGTVCLLVIDSQNKVRDCRMIKGLSVFAKFHKYDAIIDCSSDSDTILCDKNNKVLRAAIEQAERQKMIKLSEVSHDGKSGIVES
jgi:DNA-binding transcriptional regulator of glucitol operon